MSGGLLGRICMPILNIDLMTPDGILFEGNEIPDDMQNAELVSRLVNTLGLPRVTAGGEAINYSLEIVNQGIRLHDEQTLGDAGATNGDVIRLLSSHKIQKPAELEGGPMPVVANNPPPDSAPTQSNRKGAVIVIPVRGPNASVTKILGHLKESLGIRTEEVSVLNPSITKLNAPAAVAVQPSLLSVFGRYRVAVLAGLVVFSCLFLIFALSSKKKTEPITQAQEPSFPTPLPVEPTPQPTPEPTPLSIPESLSLQSSTPIPPRIVKAPRVRRRSEKLNTTSSINDSVVMPPPPKKCGVFRKIFAGCKNKEKNKSKVGGAAGAVQSAAESKTKANIRKGIDKAIP
jgi:hypothetical protein